MKFYDKMLKVEAACAQGEKTFAGACFLILVLAGFLQVLFRYVFHVTVAWAEELILFCLEWYVFIGASAATVEKKHIAVNVVVDALPEKLSKFFTVLAQILWLVFAVIATNITFTNMISSYVRGNKTLGGGFPYWFGMLALPIGLALLCIKTVILIIKTIHGEKDHLSVEETIREEMVE